MMGIGAEIKFTAAILCDKVRTHYAGKLILGIPRGIYVKLHAQARRSDAAEDIIKFGI